MAAKHWKIRVPIRQWRSNISWRGRKPKCEKKKPKATYSVALVMAFLAAENENRQLEDLPQADFGRVPERFLLTVRSNSITENFAYWKLGPLFVFEVIQRMFSSWVRQRAIFIWGLSILLFLFINKVEFYCQWRAIVFIWKTCSTPRKIPYLRAPIYYSLCVHTLKYW